MSMKISIQAVSPANNWIFKFNFLTHFTIKMYSHYLNLLFYNRFFKNSNVSIKQLEYIYSCQFKDTMPLVHIPSAYYEYQIMFQEIATNYIIVTDEVPENGVKAE